MWLQNEMGKRMQAKADALAARVKKGESLDAVAASAGTKVQRIAGISRENAQQHQALGQVDARGGDQVAQAVQRAAGLGLKVALGDGVALGDLGLIAATAPDEVRLHRHDGIAAAPGAALDAFEQESVRLALSDLQIGRDRGFQVVDQSGPDDLRLAGVIGLGEGVEGGLKAHLALPVLAASALARASVSTPMA